MRTRGDEVRVLKALCDPTVLDRDGYKCFICGLNADDVHEIISKSQFATYELDKCITPKNMVSLCRKHHTAVQGNKQASANLLRSLKELYEYNYNEEPFKWYIEEE